MSPRRRRAHSIRHIFARWVRARSAFQIHELRAVLSAMRRRSK
jgi:hypothetical protein